MSCHMVVEYWKGLRRYRAESRSPDIYAAFFAIVFSSLQSFR